MWREFNLINSFTLECSFCGPTLGLYKDCHFTLQILKGMGKLFCSTLIDYADNEMKVREAITDLEIMFPPTKAEEYCTPLSSNLGPPPQEQMKEVKEQPKEPP